MFVEGPDEMTRRMVTFVSRKWLVYDKRGNLLSEEDRVRQGPSRGFVVRAESPPPAMSAESALAEDEDWPAATRRWYEKEARRREVLAEDARADAGEPGAEIGASLRVTWLCAQRADPKLLGMFGKKGVPSGYRVAEDGLLERSVVAAHDRALWVPVVPDGNATAHLTWKRWFSCRFTWVSSARTGPPRRPTSCWGGSPTGTA